MPTKVVNTDIVFRTLNVPQSAKNKLRKDGHPITHSTKFKFEKKNNIITARFLSGGITKQTFLNEINSYKYYLEQTLNTSVERETNDFAETLKIKRTTGTGYVLVNFVYIVTKIPGQEINEGIQYEISVINKLKDAGYTQQSKSEESEGIDVSLTVNGKTAGIELKEKVNAAFGSGTLIFRNNSWTISDRSNPVIKKLVKENLKEWINDMWYIKTNGYIPNARATKKDQQVLGGGTGYYKDISSEIVKNYYGKSDYIQIKGKGFYKLSDKNPLNLPSNKASTFNPKSAKARIRVKNVSGNTYAYKIELYLGEIDRSVNFQGLDGDLSFLSETN